MTDTDDVDVVRAFTAALSPAARHHLADVNGYDQLRYIRAACEHHTPKDLARIVSAGIGRTTPANAPALIAFRLRRLSRLHTEEGDAS